MISHINLNVNVDAVISGFILQVYINTNVIQIQI